MQLIYDITNMSDISTDMKISIERTTRQAYLQWLTNTDFQTEILIAELIWNQIGEIHSKTTAKFNETWRNHGKKQNNWLSLRGSQVVRFLKGGDDR